MIRKTLALLCAFAAAVPASAGNLMLGPVKLDPTYGFQTSYEDNIYRVPRDINRTAVSGGGVRGSWIFDNDLGLKVETPLSENQKLSLGYDADFQNYTTQPSGNNAINQTAGGDYAFKGSKTKVAAYDHYVNTHDPQFNPNGTAINGALVTREARWENTAGASSEYYLGDKFFAGVDGSDDVNRYLDRSGGANSLANLLDSSVVTFGAKGGYQLAPKTRAFVAVHQVLTHYTEHTRADNHRDTHADFGVEGDLTAKLKGLVQTGLVYERYGADPANQNRQTVSRHWSFLTQLDYKATEKDTFTLMLNRATLDAETFGSRYYITTGVNAAYNHKLGEKVTLGVNAAAQQDRYSENFVVGNNNKIRRDDTYSAGLKADYQVCEWLKTGVSYSNVDRYSTFSREFNFRDNITSVNARVAF